MIPEDPQRICGMPATTKTAKAWIRTISGARRAGRDSIGTITGEEPCQTATTFQGK
jgi:hypothetical protein